MNGKILHLFCEKCQESVHIRADATSLPRCPHCMRDSLVLVTDENLTPASRETAGAHFAALRAMLQ